MEKAAESTSVAGKTKRHPKQFCDRKQERVQRIKNRWKTDAGASVKGLTLAKLGTI